jgi:hypothetical protein
MKYFELKVALSRILEKLDIIDAKVSVMPQVQVQVNGRFLATLNALSKLGRAAMAGEVAAVTGRSRACESQILNVLVCQGILEKSKQGNKKLFKLKVKVDG